MNVVYVNLSHVCNVINSLIFICTCRFYSHNESLVHDHELFNIVQQSLLEM